MVDQSKLDAATLARHLANPEGATGIAVTAHLNMINAVPYTRAIDKLQLQRNETILEVGFGNGHEIGRLIDCAAGIKYSGIDHSETMVTEAMARNAAAVAGGRVLLARGRSDDLPFEAGSFDAVLALNVICFWLQPAADLGEIRRVLKLGGRLVIGVLAPWSTNNLPVFQHGFTFYDQRHLEALLSHAGFSSCECELIHDETTTPDGKKLARDYFVMLAHV